MQGSERDESKETPTRYGYFVLQASAQSHAEGPLLSGVLEDLSTGSKQPFGSAADVARLIAEWAKESSGAPGIPASQRTPPQGPRDRT